jgi:hypothetical protein
MDIKFNICDTVSGHDLCLFNGWWAWHIHSDNYPISVRNVDGYFGESDWPNVTSSGADSIYGLRTYYRPDKGGKTRTSNWNYFVSTSQSDNCICVSPQGRNILTLDGATVHNTV